MKRVLILIPLFLSNLGLINAADENPYMFRKYGCKTTSTYGGAVYKADIFFNSNGEWRLPKGTKGYVVLYGNEQNGEEHVKTLIQDVEMYDRDNENGIPCIFIADFKTSLMAYHLEIGSNDCMPNKGVVTVTYINGGQTGEEKIPLTCEIP